MRIGGTLLRAGLVGALALASAAIGAPTDAFAQAKKKPALRVQALSKADYKRISSGASAWLHKRGRQYLVINDDGGHIRAGGLFRKLRQVAPKGSWGCAPATFSNRKQGITVRTARRGRVWTLSVTMRNRRATIAGLKCSSGS
ncbi:MAG: hypothetical protein OEQ29_16270 [Alphaproteobacteria bacterium]|nr:hypothetical protein [Alphaproteobacteria bacterium]